MNLRLLREPLQHTYKTIAQEFDIEAQLARACIDFILLCRKQVEEERGETCLGERFGNMPVARAEAAAAAAVHEHDQT